MKSIPVVLTGYGNVGKAFVRLLAKKKLDCARRFGLDLDLKAVFRGPAAGCPPGATTPRP